MKDSDITRFTFTPDPVKAEEDDEEKPQISQLHQSQTEENRAADPPSDCSETDTDDSEEWPGTREPWSGLNTLKINPCRKKDCQ